MPLYHKTTLCYVVFAVAAASLTCCSALSDLQNFQADGGVTHRHRHGDVLRRVHRESHGESILWDSASNTITEPHETDDAHISVSLQTVVENAHKPNFTLCKTYNPQVYENQPINTSVIQVEAIDLDPITAGGKVTYSIVETTDHFAVDSQTGWLRTNKIFDRDEPTREKVAYVSVRATDNGRPQLDDVCNLKVTIRDINDNRPMFDKFEYRESVPRDVAANAIVMRISATDIDDGDNGTVRYSLEPSQDLEYFEVTEDTGEVRLIKRFPDTRDAERTYTVIAVASDRGDPPQSSRTNLSIRVIEPNQKPPSFLSEYTEPIRIKELSHDRLSPIAELEANSGIANSSLVFFELLNGQTQATNKDSIFTSEPTGNKVFIRVEKPLDYELVNQYFLTVRVSNKQGLAATTVLRIEVEDENDERPFFSDVKQGSVLENEVPGTVIMRVQAIDRDGTAPNNMVSYSLGSDYVDDFSIDSLTGEIKTRRQFDRESQDVFQLEVFARDGAPSAIIKPNPLGLPNERREQIKIEIADKNDNKPRFEEPRGGYRAEIPENADTGTIVLEVRATDPDTESEIVYTIEDGDPENHFHMKTTAERGIISIQKSLDFEKLKRYQLHVKASDSYHSVFTTVTITVSNVNDNPPAFDEIEKTVTIQEETIPDYCIFNVSAYDPDIGNSSSHQGIHYVVDVKARDFFSVDPNTGCVRVKQKLDRDPPYGVPFYQAYIVAYDEFGNTSTKHYTILELIVNLTDVNDNFPILNSTNPVTWNENQGTGTVTYLTALDNDDDANGYPFTFTISPEADEDTLSTFQIVGNALRAVRQNLDRETRKVYKIPIEIQDSGSDPQKGTSILTVHIGDLNDNPMGDGESQIMIYKYQEKNLFSIGRVFVNDLDDWDIHDKVFEWDGPSHSDFVLNYADGGISMRPSVSEGTHKLKFKVTDNFRNEEARATVTVIVKEITDEAIDKSGSIRFRGITQEEFVTRQNGKKSKQELLRSELARIFNLPEENVDVFTVLNPDSVNDKKVVDVRFTAHGSPIYHAEKMEGLIAPEKDKLEKVLGVEIDMVGVDECIQENLFCENSCFNELTKSPALYRIVTNTSSFVGITSYISPQCKCKSDAKPTSCQPNPCYHEGICRSGPQIEGFKCECAPGFEGSRCETTAISFHGSGYAWYPPLSVCADTFLQLTFSTVSPDGVILYNGPTHRTTNNVSDFVSLELKDGRPVALLDYGSGVLRLNLSSSPSLSDGKDHLVTLTWNPSEIAMTIDTCHDRAEYCFVKGQKVGSHSSLNVNGPLQLGGISFDPKTIQEYKNWDHVPSTRGFYGCISNLTLNGEYFDLGEPSFAKGNVTNCDIPLVGGVQFATVAIGFNFILILIICLLILLILLIFVLFYRRKRLYEQVKGEPGDDVRENIINYSDEGGGEGDHAGYDLSVLMKPGISKPPYSRSPLDKRPKDNSLPRRGVDPDTDLGPFLQGNKDRVDKDPHLPPYDDVRNYAYEGDGASMGSLSSLASGTDDEDIDFDFLPSLGPRFNKLADMYSNPDSDDERTNRPRPSKR